MDKRGMVKGLVLARPTRGWARRAQSTTASRAAVWRRVRRVPRPRERREAAENAVHAPLFFCYQRVRANFC